MKVFNILLLTLNCVPIFGSRIETTKLLKTSIKVNGSSHLELRFPRKILINNYKAKPFDSIENLYSLNSCSRKFVILSL